MPSAYTEDNLVEQPVIRLMAEMGWRTVRAFDERFSPEGELDFGAKPYLGREHSGQVVLEPILREALQRINSDASAGAIDLAVEQITTDRSSMSAVEANRQVYHLIRDGIKLHTIDPVSGDGTWETVRLIDVANPEANDFLLVSQLWVTGAVYKRRTDLVGFVNGIPLVFIELKASHKNLQDAYSGNLRDYKETIPQLFWYNAFAILSNGLESRVGTITSGWEHFVEWKRINDEGEKGAVSLETIIRGVCDKARFLDLFENFLLFETTSSGQIKLLAKNHQYLGVNRAIASFQNAKENKGRIGVYWHTQGGGKSYSMVFFSQKILRTVPGNYTFVVVTDRTELDGQIYKNFARVGAVTEPEEMIRAQDRQHLRQLLGEDHRVVFTLIQKFQTSEGESQYPELSNRDDIIVMTDEAHRSQYDRLALNMRNALPNANFIGFTGTPLIDGEEQETRETFGEYVSVYDFAQSVADGATIPLYYENRIPKLQLDADALGQGIDEVLEEAELDRDQEKKLEDEFSSEYHLITREDRLDAVAKDIVEHFNGRGTDGKGLVVCIDRLTAVKMYDKMKAQPGCPDIAVMMSSSQNEAADFAKHGLDILPHRIRMKNEDLEEKFKDPADPLRIVIVCNMWLTGFDVPVLSTIYLDKPMKNHSLMQTIARANRVYPGKQSGLIVDYIGVFRNLQKALAIYAIGGGNDLMPVQNKEELVVELREAIASADEYCAKNGAELHVIEQATDFERLAAIDRALDVFLATEERTNEFLARTNHLARLLSAVMPDRAANEFFGRMKLYRMLADRVRLKTRKDFDVADIADKIEGLLDEAIRADGYLIDPAAKPYDLSSIDFEALRKRFAEKGKHVEAEELKQSVAEKIKKLVQFNPTRNALLESFERLVHEYNTGAKNIEQFFEALMQFAQQLNEEEQRAVRESLNEEELAIFDLLYKADVSEDDKNEIKKIAQELLAKLKTEQLTIDWRNTQQGRARVRVQIRSMLYNVMPASYPEVVIQEKLNLVFDHVYSSYPAEGHGIYRWKPSA